MLVVGLCVCMSVADTSSDATYSIDDDREDLRAEFEAEFDHDDPDTYRVDSCWCGSLRLCPT